MTDPHFPSSAGSGDEALSLPLAALQLPLNGFTDHVGDLLAFCQRRFDAVPCPFRESGGDLFEIYLRPTHFVDITY